MKLFEQGCGSNGLLFSSGWNGTPTTRMVGQLDDLGKLTVGAHPREDQSSFLKRALIVDVNLVAVTGAR